MKQILIDKNEILSFPREDYSGFANFAYDMINKTILMIVLTKLTNFVKIFLMD